MTLFNIWLGIAIGLYFGIGYLLVVELFTEEDREDSFIIYLVLFFWVLLFICKILGLITDKIRKKVCG